MDRETRTLAFAARWIAGLYHHGICLQKTLKEEDWLEDRLAPALLEKLANLEGFRIRTVQASRNPVEILCGVDLAGRSHALAFSPAEQRFALDGKPFEPPAPDDPLREWADLETRLTPILDRAPRKKLEDEKDPFYREKTEKKIERLEKALSREYAGLASDYDGTLSEGKGYFVTPEIYLRIADLLLGGVPVAIVTNRKDVKGFPEALEKIVDRRGMENLHLYLDHGRLGYNAATGPQRPYYEREDDPRTLHKIPALEDFSRRIGAAPDAIAKIGDEGHDRKDSRGGDAAFLEGPGSFAVMRWDSKNPNQVGVPAVTGLYGPAGTLWLLWRLRFSCREGDR